MSEATIPPSYAEYNITYPIHEYEKRMATSYKDAIDVSWTVAAPNHLPILQIECWFRNRSASVGYAPDLVANILTLTDPNMTTVQVVLEPYKPYRRCQFSMIDSQNHTLTDNNGGLSGDFTISDTNNLKSQIWSLSNPAPMSGLTATTKSAGAYVGLGGATLWATWALVMSALLLAL